MGFYIAHFKCSIEVGETGFSKATKILKACKHENLSMKVELYSKVVDVYNYGMSFYEILTSKLPFEGHPKMDYNGSKTKGAKRC